MEQERQDVWVQLQEVLKKMAVLLWVYLLTLSVNLKIYSIAIITAILTSAISSGYGVAENIKDRRKYKTITFAMCLAEIPIAYIGFGKLVEILYPLFGVIGIIQIITILKKVNSIAKNVKN